MAGRSFRTVTQFVLPVIFTGLASGWCFSQEVHWRSDYNAARREAQEKGLPIILDFGTENCFWCKKLDDGPFRDPLIVRVLNERFIPLKVDAVRSGALTDALRVSGFPTLVLAAPDGKILNSHEGFVDADKLHEMLQRVLAGLSNPDWMVRDYEDAAKAIAESDFARALSLLRHIAEDDRGRPVQIKAKQLLGDLEQQASARLAKAQQLEDQGQFGEAETVLSTLSRTYPGTQADKEARQKLAVLAVNPERTRRERAVRAKELLVLARKDYEARQYLCCLERCETLAATYIDLPEGGEAARLAGDIKNNPEWMRQACESLSHRLGTLYLDMAETCLKKGQPQQAAVYLERVVQTFPGSRYAETAQTRLAQLQGQPQQRTEFKK